LLPKADYEPAGFELLCSSQALLLVAIVAASDRAVALRPSATVRERQGHQAPALLASVIGSVRLIAALISFGALAVFEVPVPGQFAGHSGIRRTDFWRCLTHTAASSSPRLCAPVSLRSTSGPDGSRLSLGCSGGFGAVAFG
jgi:hypothetical protein